MWNKNVANNMPLTAYALKTHQIAAVIINNAILF